MNNLIKYLLYLLVALLLVSWLITVGKSCGKSDTQAAQNGAEAVESYEITDANSKSGMDEDSIDFGEELESILDEEEELESILDEEEEAELDYSSYDPEEDVVEKEKPKSTPPPARSTSTTTPKTTTTQKSSSGRYMVVAGSFIHPDNADRMKSKLSGLGYPAEVVVFDLSEYYTVLAGRYPEFDAAQNAVNKLSTKGIDCYVKKQTF